MTPSKGREDCVSGQDLRGHAQEKLRSEVSAGQLHALRDHGFIQELEPGCWAREAKEALVKALKLAKSAKHLDRRSLYRFAQEPDSIPAPNLKANMVSVLNKLAAPVKKLHVVLKAMKKVDLNVPRRQGRILLAGLRATLERAEAEQLKRTATAAIHLSSYVDAVHASRPDVPELAGIKALRTDERLVLLTLAELLKAPSDQE